jgi:Na+-driven multidrug efflux pump
MFITVGISLYTSRVVLSTLGVTDFGVYNIVGGVVMMFTFLNSTFSSATSRFLTFELGKPKKEKLAKVFGAAITIHLGIAVITFLFLETIGLWFLNNKLLIPENRMFAAHIVYQFSILSCIISIIKVPYNAAIIAHERMKIYAYVSIMEALLKLLIIYLLVIGEIDKLILYSILIFAVTTIVSTFYILYSYMNFVECKFKVSTEKEFIKPMIYFSSWDLYGNISVVARGPGINILLNIFFGPVINAASGIATQVQNTLAGFIDNILIAVRPQIVKNFASGNIAEMQSLIFNTSKFSFLLLFIVSLPLMIENHFVLNLWLKDVPDYTIIFCQLSILNNLISIMFRTIMYSIHATGKVKRMSLINGTIYLLVLPISYFMLKASFSPVVTYIVNIFLLVMGSVSNLIILHKYIPEFSISAFYHKVIYICLLVVVISTILPLSINHIMEEGFVRFILVGFTTLVSVSISTYYMALNEKIRNQIKLNLLNRLHLK